MMEAGMARRRIGQERLGFADAQGRQMGLTDRYSEVSVSS
jgi:hypothetical protein